MHTLLPQFKIRGTGAVGKRIAYGRRPTAVRRRFFTNVHDRLDGKRNFPSPGSQFLFTGRGQVAADPAEDEELYRQQAALSAILESAVDYRDARMALQNSPLARSSWHVEAWQPHMLQTAVSIAQKWKNGFPPRKKRVLCKDIKRKMTPSYPGNPALCFAFSRLR